MPKIILTQSIVKEYFEYHESGYLTWKKHRQGYLLGERFGGESPQGYRIGMFKLKTIPEHRLIFLLHHNFLPEQVDHINHIKNDNRIENLRAATHSQNQHNRT